MKYNIDDRLARLKARRFDVENDYLRDRAYTESFEKRTANKATRYVLGAMQEVNSRSTQISFEEFEKVKKALSERLSKHRLSPHFRLQGSVLMNTHIRGVSDVDMLEIHGDSFTYAIRGPKANTYFPSSSKRTIVDDVLQMRQITESELSTHFWGASVEKSHAKSIQLSGGGFRRKIDVVPSHWFDSIGYQADPQERNRGVGVVDKYTRVQTLNYPFLFVHYIDQKAMFTNEGAKMAIRLLKNVKSDGDDDIELSSYDIASLVYHCESGSITRQAGRELTILSGIDAYLSYLVSDKARAEQLMSPDNTRRILDKAEKWPGLVKLSQGVSTLASEVYTEIVGSSYIRDGASESVRKALNESKIPILMG